MKRQKSIFVRGLPSLFNLKSILLITCLCIGIQSCGFQLNRNRMQLPDGADSIAIERIENRSYIPRLDIRLKSQLIERFNASSIPIRLSNQADLVLTFVIKSFQRQRENYALDDTEQTYEYKFTATGELTVFDNRSNRFYLQSSPLNQSYSYITSATDLTSSEIDEGREELLDALSQAIAAKLTDRF